MIGINYTLLVAIIAAILACATDIPLSWTSPVYPKLYSNDSSVNPFGKPITQAQDAWIGSLLSIGAIVGPLPFAYVAGRYGRKPGLLSISVLLIAAFFASAFVQNVYEIYVARFATGFSMGAAYAVLPTYFSEISEDYNRGMICQVLNVFWALGNFIPYVLGPFTSYELFNIYITCIPIVFFILFLILAPETPYYLIMKGRDTSALKSLQILRSSKKECVMEELERIKKQIKNEQPGQFLDLFRNSTLRKALIIAVFLTMSQELCGFVAILFYMELIFTSTGTTIPADISSLLVAIVILFTSVISPFYVDKTGRRFLLIISSFGMCLSLFLLGGFFYIKFSTEISTNSIFWLPLASLMAYILSFNLGLSSIPWTISSEIFPNNYKNMANMIASSLCWLTSFAITKSFNDMNNTFGQAGSFWLFSGLCFVCGVFNMFCVPETKGKSFSAIQEIIASRSLFRYGLCTDGLKNRTVQKKIPEVITMTA